MNSCEESVLYRAGIIERWGSGTLNIVDWCAENGNPPPKWREEAGSVFVIFAPATPGGGPEVTGEVGGEVRSLLSVCRGTMTRGELQDALALKSEENFSVLYLTPALDTGLVEMTIPDKPRSSKQKYRLTEKGRRLLSQVVGDSK
jgi:ATP-dependent DNA helicase RecG